MYDLDKDKNVTLDFISKKMSDWAINLPEHVSNIQVSCINTQGGRR